METFYEAVIRKNEQFDCMTRVHDINLLEPGTRKAILAIVEEARTGGIELMIYETYRSQVRQQELFQRGASKLKTVGVHHYGLACDLVKFIGGEPSWKGDFSFLRVLARNHGLIWGGDWGNPTADHSFVDAVHVQRCAVAVQSALFRGTWFPGDDYDPYTFDHDSILAA